MCYSKAKLTNVREAAPELVLRQGRGILCSLHNLLQFLGGKCKAPSNAGINTLLQVLVIRQMLKGDARLHTDVFDL